MHNREIQRDVPFARTGHGVSRMMWHSLAALAVLAALYAVVYDPMFFLRWCGYVLLGLGLECTVIWITTGRFRVRSGSSAMTAGLLVLSVPPGMPFLPMFYALIVAVVLVRAPGDRGLRLNPMLMGRLFLMLAYKDEIVAWTRLGVDPDVVTTATPIELYHAEEYCYDLFWSVSGWINGTWEELYEIVPGGPGEMFKPVILLLGLLLCLRGVVAWRTGVAFLLAFAATCLAVGEPVVFNLFSGAVIFAAVFVAGDPFSTPESKAGKWVAGIIAGVVDALIRAYTVYSEGIVFSFLLVSILSPLIDRTAFCFRGVVLRARLRRNTAR